MSTQQHKFKAGQKVKLLAKEQEHIDKLLKIGISQLTVAKLASKSQRIASFTPDEHHGDCALLYSGYYVPLSCLSAIVSKPRKQRPRKFKVGQTVLISFTTEEQKAAAKLAYFDFPTSDVDELRWQSGVIKSIDTYSTGVTVASIDRGFRNDGVAEYVYDIPLICLL